jgi:hypothetical protein
MFTHPVTVRFVNGPLEGNTGVTFHDTLMHWQRGLLLNVPRDDPGNVNVLHYCEYRKTNQVEMIDGQPVVDYEWSGWLW